MLSYLWRELFSPLSEVRIVDLFCNPKLLGGVVGSGTARSMPCHECWHLELCDWTHVASFLEETRGRLHAVATKKMEPSS